MNDYASSIDDFKLRLLYLIPSKTSTLLGTAHRNFFAWTSFSCEIFNSRKFMILILWYFSILAPCYYAVGEMRPSCGIDHSIFVLIRPQVAQAHFVSVFITLLNSDNLLVLPIHLLANN